MEKRKHCALLVEMYIDVAIPENNTEGLQKIKNKIVYDTAIPLLGIHLKKMKTNSKSKCTPYVHSCNMYNNQGMKVTCVHQQING